MTLGWTLVLLLLAIHRCQNGGAVEWSSIVELEPDEFPLYSLKTPQPVSRDLQGCFCIERDDMTACYRETCMSFPRVKVTTNIFRLRATSVQALERGDFLNMTQVSRIEIESNSRLSRIEPGVFMDVPSTTHLSICYNVNLKALEEGTFTGLANLTELRLVKNGFHKVPDVTVALTPDVLPNLASLSLSENVFRSIGSEDFMSMSGSPVEELDLGACQLELFHPSALLYLENLSVLKLSENSVPISILQALLRAMSSSPLSTLDLRSSGFRGRMPKDLLETVAETNISRLILSYNQFSYFDEDSFPFMPTLKELDLKGVLLQSVETDALLSLPNLSTLNLTKNKLIGVPSGVLVPQLESLDLSENSAGPFTGSTYFDLGSRSFVNMTNLTVLNLSYNRLGKLSPTSLYGLRNLRILGMKNASIFELGNGSFSSLRSLVFLNLERNPLTPNSLVYGTFNGLVNLRTLLLGDCGITHFPDSSVLQDMLQLAYLSLKSNSLKTLDPHLFMGLRNLRGIDLSDNKLEAWKGTRLFGDSPYLSQVYLVSNQISHFSPEMLDDFCNLTKLDLSDNTFACDCSLLNLKQWLQTDGQHVRRINQTIFNTVCFRPDDWRDRPLSEFLTVVDSNLCEIETLNMVIFVAVPVLVLLACALVFAALTYHFRWYVRYWIFLVRTKKKRSAHEASEGYANYQYDAFVSYNHEDRNFVVRMVSMLENYEPHFRLCVYERDFEIGTVISEAIIQSIHESRKTVLVLSDNFAKSQWCMWELNMAQHRLFEEKWDALVLVKLGSVAEQNITPTLRYLMKSRVYLEWDAAPEKQRVFWDKLRAALAKPSVGVQLQKTS